MGAVNMKIGLIDVDSHRYPNLALMKISAWHKARGDTVEWWWSDLIHYDVVYMSKVFSDTYTPDNPEPLNADQVIKGGTGYAITLEDGREVYHPERDKPLPPEIEHIYPDYSLYPELTRDTAYGFLTRGCPRACHFCIVSCKEGRASVKAADLSEWWSGQKNIKLLDPNLLACREHMDLLGQLADSGALVDFTQGVDVRLLTKKNIEALNKVKTKMIHFAWDKMDQSEKVLQGLEMYAKYGEIQDRRRRIVYVLTNYNTTMEENLYRIYKLREMGFDPDVRVYDKPNAPKEVRMLQRWVNNRTIWGKCARFEDYIA